MDVLGDLEGASAATFSQVVSEAHTVLLYQAFLDDIGAGIGQCVEEVAGFPPGNDDDRAGVRGEQAITDDGFDLADIEPIRILDEGQVGRAGGGLFGRLQGAVETVGYIGGGQGRAITKVQVGPQVESPGQAIGGHLPGLGHLRDDLLVVVELHQACEDHVDGSN